jgi:hypothetical protein
MLEDPHRFLGKPSPSVTKLCANRDSNLEPRLITSRNMQNYALKVYITVNKNLEGHKTKTMRSGWDVS